MIVSLTANVSHRSNSRSMLMSIPHCLPLVSLMGVVMNDAVLYASLVLELIAKV